MLQRSPGLLVCGFVAFCLGAGLTAPLEGQTAHYVGTQAPLSSGLRTPEGVAVDTNNTVYLADTANNRILKETPSGAGYTETVITDSRIASPIAIAVDAAGNLYILAARSPVALIRLALSNGVYTSSSISSTVGSALGVAVTLDGTALYVTDPTNKAIYQFALFNGSYVAQPTAIVPNSTQAPLSVATDKNGAWYFTTGPGGAIYKHSAGFSGATYSGTSIAVPTNEFATGIAVDASGNIFIADTYSNRILEVPGGASTSSPVVLASNVSGPEGIGVDSNGRVIYNNTNNNTAVVQTPAANFGSLAVGNTSAAQTLAFVFDTAGILNSTAPYQAVAGGAANLDYAVVAGAGTTCTASTSFAAGATCTVRATFTPVYPGSRNGAVLLNGSAGQPIAVGFLGGAGVGPQLTFPPVQSVIDMGLVNPGGIAVDGAGQVYVADTYQNFIIKETYANGTWSYSIIANSSNGLLRPQSVAVDGAGNVYVSDTYHGRLVKLTYSASGYSQSTIDSALGQPWGMAIDGAGNIFVADATKNAVLKETYANGAYTQSTVVSGLNSPYGVAVDAAGTLYVADTGNSRVLLEAYANGTYTQAATTISSGIGYPYSVAVDAAGNLYIADPAVSSNVFKESYAGGVYSQSTVGSGLVNPYAVAVDSLGNLYVADHGNNRAVLEAATVPPALTFGSAAVGTVSSDSPQALPLSNIGNQPLTVSAVPVGSDFRVNASACTGTSLASGSSCSLMFSYAPQHVGGGPKESYSIQDNNLNVPSQQTGQLIGGNATQGSQTISFVQVPASGSYLNQTTLPLSVTASSGQAVKLSAASTGNISTKQTNTQITLSGSGSGTVTLTATQGGNADYAAAPTATYSFSVTIVNQPSAAASLADTAIGSSSAATVSVQVLTAGTLGSVAGLTQGTAGLDYTASLNGGSCTAATAIAVGQVCSATVTFSPRYAGPRYGAVQLLDGSGNILGMTYLQANGLGAQVAFPPSQTVIGSGLFYPYGVAVDGAGNVYVTDSNNNRVLKEVYANGVYTQSSTVIGSGWNNPYGVAADGAGNVYVADSSNNRVVKEVYANGVYTQSSTTIGSGLKNPNGLAVDGAGNVYIADSSNNRVLKEVYANGAYTQFSTPIGSGLSLPADVAVDGAGNVYIADYGNNRVVKEVYANGTYAQSSTTIGSGLNGPGGVAVDGVGNVYIADYNNSRVLKEVYANGVYTQSSTTIGSGLSYPIGVAVDGAGNVYIADTSNSRALVESVTTPPTLAFPYTATGVTSAPVATTVTNPGNQPLVFSVPGTGVNPQTAANFVLETNSDTTCPVVNAGGSPVQLAANTTCTLSYVFAPMQLGALTSTSVLTDNALNVPGSTQTITLKGQATQGTQTAQTITFPQPSPGEAYTSATLTATASSGLAVAYAIASGPATVSGSSITYTGPGTVMITATQPGNVTYSAAPPVSVSVNVVVVKNVWLLNGSGSVASFDESGSPGSGPYGVTGQMSSKGGLAFDSSLRAWSVTSGTNFLFSVNNTGSNAMIYSGGGISAASGIAIDGAGQVWIANSTGSLSEFTNAGAPLSPSSGFTGVTVSANAGGTTAYASPAGIAVDLSGNIWVTNAGTSTVTEVLGAAAPAVPLSIAVTTGTTGTRP